jgi:hypothetical protein
LHRDCRAPVCGSGKIRVTTSGRQRQACWATREKCRRRRTELRRSCAGRKLSWLIGERSRKGRVMLAQYEAWQALREDPLPRGRAALERLQTHSMPSRSWPLGSSAAT